MDYLSLEFDSPTINLNNESFVSTPKQSETPKPSTINDLDKNQVIIFSSIIGVIGLFILIGLILSILGLNHEPPISFTPDTMIKLNQISANVSIVDSAIQATGFIDNTGFSAIGGTVKTGTLDTTSIIGHSLTTNEFVATTLEAPNLEINEVKTNLIQLNETTFNPTSISYSNSTSNQTNTLEAKSIVLLNTTTTDSSTISSNNIVFHQNSGKIKNLESLRFLASDLVLSTTQPTGVATLFLPTITGVQFGNLTIPFTDLRLGSTFRITATGTYHNQSGAERYATLCVSNTENKTGDQPSQIIIGNLTTDGMFIPINGAATWVYTCTFSITNITTPTTTHFEAFGTTSVKGPNGNFQGLINHTNTNIDIQLGLELTIWGSWTQSDATLTLNQLFVEHLF